MNGPVVNFGNIVPQTRLWRMEKCEYHLMRFQRRAGREAQCALSLQQPVSLRDNIGTQ